MSEPQPSQTSGAPDPRDTKERLLEAAERLFAERGFEGASLRAVTQAAGTSVSAANYHFGSKEELLRAVLLRVVEPMNERRLERLSEAEQAAGGAPLPLEDILAAYLDPLFEERASWAGARRDVRFVAARLYTDPPELVSAMKQELFGEIGRRFLEAIARSVPERRIEELGLRFQFAVGAMVHVMSGQLEDAPLFQDLPRPAEANVRDQLIAFFAAGLRAPVEIRS